MMILEQIDGLDCDLVAFYTNMWQKEVANKTKPAYINFYNQLTLLHVDVCTETEESVEPE
jgi:hypothetical protein